MNQYIDQFYKMRMNPNPVSGQKSPHKVVMMLAVMDLIAAGDTDGNCIEYSPELLEGFRLYFDVVKNPFDACTPLNPFWHLKTSPFWHHKIKEGKNRCTKAMVRSL